MRLAIVVQRYGEKLNGGAELHARYIAKRLSRHAKVEVLTTRARDYISWKNEFPEGQETIEGILVRRFGVSRIRDPHDFGRRSERVFNRRHSLNDELKWLDSEGPTSPALIRYLQAHETDYDYFIFFSYRYYHAYHGIYSVPSRAILVPTAERDPALGLKIFSPMFRAVRAIMYNSPEEEALIQAASANQHIPGVVVGVGSEVPTRTSAERFRQRTKLSQRFAIYVGRVDENKGCNELFNYFQQYARAGGRLDLVVVGNPVMKVPTHPRIHQLGFVSEEEKYDAIVAAETLIMPSYFESLSMVTLEAWAMGIPVLVNGHCDVLRGQTVRGKAGLYYTNMREFSECLQALDHDEQLRSRLGENGRVFFRDHYSWPVVEQKYLNMFKRLNQEKPDKAVRTVEPQKGWIARYQRNIRPASNVISELPTGPVVEHKES